MEKLGLLFSHSLSMSDYSSIPDVPLSYRYRSVEYTCHLAFLQKPDARRHSPAALRHIFAFARQTRDKVYEAMVQGTKKDSFSQTSVD
jgi:hypothetical protein